MNTIQIIILSIFIPLILILIMGVLTILFIDYWFNRNYLKQKSQYNSEINAITGDFESKSSFIRNNYHTNTEGNLVRLIDTFMKETDRLQKSCNILDSLVNSKRMVIVKKIRILKQYRESFSKITKMYDKFNQDYQIVFDDVALLNELIEAKQYLLKMIFKYLDENKSIFPRKYGMLRKRNKSIVQEINDIESKESLDIKKKYEQVILLSKNINLLIEEIKINYNIEFNLFNLLTNKIAQLKKEIKINIQKYPKVSGFQLFLKTHSKLEKRLEILKKEYHFNHITDNIKYFKNIQDGYNKLNYELNLELSFRSKINFKQLPLVIEEFKKNYRNIQSYCKEKFIKLELINEYKSIEKLLKIIVIEYKNIKKLVKEGFGSFEELYLTCHNYANILIDAMDKTNQLSSACVYNYKLYYDFALNIYELNNMVNEKNMEILNESDVTTLKNSVINYFKDHHITLEELTN